MVAACGGASRPEADPAVVTRLAKQMIKATPPPGASRACRLDELAGGATMTYVTVARLAKEPLPDSPSFADWINPAELDAPAARTLLVATASETERRQSAAELMAAPFYLVYLVDNVNAPIALGVKELKQGFASARAIRYTKTGVVECLMVFTWENDDERSKWGIAMSNRPTIDPEVAKAMQEDLRTEMLKRVSTLAQPQPKRTKGMAPKPPS